MEIAKTIRMEIAKTIIQQLGGAKRLQVMIGAYNFMAVDNGVVFGFKGCKKANKVKVILTPRDDYTMKFYKISMHPDKIEQSFKPVSESTIHNDGLIELFENFTGLHLRL